jgi:hypothetical protein
MWSRIAKHWRLELAALGLGAMVAVVVLTLRAAADDPKPVPTAPVAPVAPATPSAAPAANGEAPVKEESNTVTVTITVVPGRRATVLWGKRVMGVIPPRDALVLQRPRDSGPLDLTIKADGCMPVHTRAYTFSDSQLSVRVMSYDQRSTLLGYKQEVVPDAGLAQPAAELPAAPP